MKAKKLFAAWAQFGNVLIRKSENSKIIHIEDHCDLRDFRDNDASQSEMEVFRGNPSATSEQSSRDRLSVVTHITDYEYYVDSDI